MAQAKNGKISRLIYNRCEIPRSGTVPPDLLNRNLNEDFQYHFKSLIIDKASGKNRAG